MWESTSPEPAAFGDPAQWPPQDLIGISAQVGPELIATGYRAGVFPMPHGDQVAWFSPTQRGILPYHRLRISRSLRKSLRRYHYTTDTDFLGVIKNCANPSRDGAWIDDYITRAYAQLFARGVVHTVETRDESGRLVGGLYGVQLGGLFAGESMFHDPARGRDASKAALVYLVELQRAAHPDGLLDVQWATPHLQSLGVITISRRQYLSRLNRALALEPPHWPSRD